MPRKVTKKLQRELKPDRKYQSVLVQKLINKSMLDGKKLTAEKAVYSALETAAKKVESENPLEVFEKALKNISPSFEVKSRRVGGANYQIPFPVQGHRQLHRLPAHIVPGRHANPPSTARARTRASPASALVDSRQSAESYGSCLRRVPPLSDRDSHRRSAATDTPRMRYQMLASSPRAAGLASQPQRYAAYPTTSSATRGEQRTRL